MPGSGQTLLNTSGCLELAAQVVAPVQRHALDFITKLHTLRNRLGICARNVYTAAAIPYNKSITPVSVRHQLPSQQNTHTHILASPTAAMSCIPHSWLPGRAQGSDRPWQLHKAVAGQAECKWPFTDYQRVQPEDTTPSPSTCCAD